MSIVIDSIESHIVYGYPINAYCDACLHRALLDLDALSKKLGPDFSISRNHAWFCSKLKCEKCGHRGGNIRLGTPGVSGNFLSSWGRGSAGISS